MGMIQGVGDSKSTSTSILQANHHYPLPAFTVQDDDFPFPLSAGYVRSLEGIHFYPIYSPEKNMLLLQSTVPDCLAQFCSMSSSLQSSFSTWVKVKHLNPWK